MPVASSSTVKTSWSTANAGKKTHEKFTAVFNRP